VPQCIRGGGGRAGANCVIEASVIPEIGSGKTVAEVIMIGGGEPVLP